MKPTLYDIQYDPILSRVSIAYQNDKYIAEQILPTILSKERTGKYYSYDTGKFRKVHTLRGMGSASREVGHGVSLSDAYVINEHSLVELVPDELVDQSPAPLTPMMDAAENVVEKLLIEKEYDLATWMKLVANFTNDTTLSSTTQWSDYANSDPIGDIRTGKQAIHSSIFRDPNTLVLGKEVYDKLIDHPDIIDRIKYSQLGIAGEALLAKLFGVEKVLIGGAGYESAVEGNTSSMSYIWGKYAWLLYITPKPTIKNISFGYHFQMKAPRRADKWYDKPREGTFVRVHDDYVREIVAEKCGYLIKDAVA